MPDRQTSRNSRHDANITNYTHILGFFRPTIASDVDDSDKINRASVVFKTKAGFEDTLKYARQDAYKGMGGFDLSSLFMPYSTTSGVMPYLPAPSGQDDSLINATKLTPFYVDPTATQIRDLNDESGYAPVKDIVSGNRYPGSPSQFRHRGEIRGIALRLPAIGVGWGYTTNGNPWPQDSDDSSLFKGGAPSGQMLDPKNYVAAPIDLRYDTDRNVWTGGGESNVKHQHLENTAGDGGPAFSHFFPDSLIQASGLGYGNLVPTLIQM